MFRLAAPMIGGRLTSSLYSRLSSYATNSEKRLCQSGRRHPTLSYTISNAAPSKIHCSSVRKSKICGFTSEHFWIELDRWHDTMCGS